MLHNIINPVLEKLSSLGDVGLMILSFAESSFFPIPPDFLLIAMSLSTPQKALYFALICSLFSGLGGAFGYAVGKWGGKPVFDFLFRNKRHYLDKVHAMYDKHGVKAVLISAFTPIPYKVFTIASGIFEMKFIPFLVASFIGRGARFFLVSIVLLLAGETITKYLDIVVILTTVAIIVFYLLVKKVATKRTQLQMN